MHFRGALTAASFGDVLKTRGCFLFGLAALDTREQLDGGEGNWAKITAL